MRSVLAALKGAVRTVHLLLWDTAFHTDDVHLLQPEARDNLQADLDDDDNEYTSLSEYLSKTWRVVQTPSWLNFGRTHLETPGERTPHFRYAAHSEIYRIPNVDSDGTPLEPGEAAWHEREWLKDALPTYDSMRIESRIAFLPDMADVAVAFNDDYFLLRPLAVSDFHSPLYGSILRFKHDNERITTELNPQFFGTDGEYGGLFQANHLLSQRYPVVPRPYLLHVPKVITQSLQVEATLMFSKMSTLSASKRFRELPIGHGDLQSQWLQIALRTERWREAMLWTWVVAKLGGANGSLGQAEREQVGRLLGKTPGTNGSVEVVRGPRETLKHIETNFAHAGWDNPKNTEYVWSSLDGHLPMTGKKTADPVENAKCTIDLEKCFDTFWTEGQTTAAHMFKHLAFRHPKCGDCLLMALEIFPSPDATYTIPKTASPPPYIAPPHLPMTPTWDEADFSLSKALAKTALPGDKVPLRQWTMHLLSRYLYTYGKSDVVFTQLRTPESAADQFASLDLDEEPSVLCLNDDIERNYNEVLELVGTWFEKRWPNKAGWER
ncbi:uncharacterized protein CcaverHIS019_0100260 [Cutaneotrichosporon cavernicola]|uniref:Stealth protein CR4 conserved region 4 domain-containing protein n=1 Tax=Cutaneotrichosporon cavernicola TaxID=279322 RepID=A0AA48L1Q5_9TREE|nr:uncharacterized protein CcaverHIS019_0100260 [Cutaneotrichosporon cavernicola]BEI87308.1 hypothetical protein CcaverHIS019_0100260 [Cutaneotrichosporon cavernicola]